MAAEMKSVRTADCIWLDFKKECRYTKGMYYATNHGMRTKL